MDELKLNLSEEAQQNPQEAIQCLIDASNDISKATEKDFEEMKSKKWYKRLWELITFSKDNQKRLAHGVANLAKLQEIVMKALLILSEQSANTAEIVKKNSEIIDTLCKKVNKSDRIQLAIISDLERLKSGVEETITIDRLDDDKRVVALSAVCEIAREIGSDDPLAQEYIRALLNTAGCTAADIQDVNYEYIEEFSKSEALLLYNLIMEYLYIATDSFDTDSEIMDFININNRKSKSIREQIQDVVRIAGKEALLCSFDTAYDLYDIDEDFIEFIEDHEADDAEYIDESPQEMEEITLSEILNISKDEIRTFSYKIIHFRSYTNCEGTIEFRNCILYYNETSDADEITLTEGASLVMENCEVICKGFDKKPFISGRKNSFEFVGCTFKDCSCFVDAITPKIINLANSLLEDCFTHFITMLHEQDAATEFNITNCKLTFNDIKQYNINGANSLSILSHRDIICIKDYYGNKQVKGKITNSIIEASKDYKNAIQQDKDLLNLFSSKTGIFDLVEREANIIVENCSFVNTYNCISGGSVYNCTFTDCSDCIMSQKVSECIFIRSTNIIKCNWIGSIETLITKCKFIDCYNILISGGDWGNVVVEFCEFDNIINNWDDKERSPDWAFKCILLQRMKNKESRINTIRKCVFKNIEMNYGFLIGCAGYEKMDYLVGVIENCDFRNCFTKRSAGKIINEYYKYNTLFKKNQDFHAIKVSNCTGLDKINVKMPDTNDSSQNGHSDERTNEATITPLGVASISSVAGIAAGVLLGPIGAAFASTAAVAAAVKKNKSNQSYSVPENNTSHCDDKVQDDRDEEDPIIKVNDILSAMISSEPVDCNGDKGYELANLFCKNDAENVTIPSQIKGKKIVVLSMSSCTDLKSVRNITIENGIKKISYNAFSDLKKLEKIELPQSVDEIYANAFMRCTNLKTINIPDNISKLGFGAFAGCFKLKEITYKGNTYSYKNIAELYNLFSDNQIVQDDNYLYEYIPRFEGYEVSEYYRKDNEAIIPAEINGGKVRSVAVRVFDNCRTVTSVRISEGIQLINTSAFDHCMKLEEIYLPDSIVTLSPSFVNTCNNLKRVIFRSKEYKASEIKKIVKELEPPNQAEIDKAVSDHFQAITEEMCKNMSEEEAEDFRSLMTEIRNK